MWGESLGGPGAYVDQWHLTAHTKTPAAELKCLAVMVPYRRGETPPVIVPLHEQNSLGFRVGGTQVAAWWGAGEQGKISLAGLSGDGRFVLRADEKGKVSRIVSK